MWSEAGDTASTRSVCALTGGHESLPSSQPRGEGPAVLTLRRPFVFDVTLIRHHPSWHQPWGPQGRGGWTCHTGPSGSDMAGFHVFTRFTSRGCDPVCQFDL